MDRLIQYPAQIPLVEDMLNAQRNAMVGIGHLAGGAFGANTVAASGFTCAPGEGLALTIAPGALLAPGVVDASAYGALAAVSSALVRQFISRDPVTLTVPAAGATYIVHVSPQTVDADDTVLPFYNASDPSVTYAGEGNSGLAAPTVRRDEAALSIGATVPEGSYPLWQIAVPAGATAVTAEMISVASGAPFYPSLAAVAPRIVAPFNAQLAAAMGGYPFNAVVADPETPGTFWVSTADANVSTPGADGATWQNLFNGYATQAVADKRYLMLASTATQTVSGPVSFSSAITVNSGPNSIGKNGGTTTAYDYTTSTNILFGTESRLAYQQDDNLVLYDAKGPVFAISREEFVYLGNTVATQDWASKTFATNTALSAETTRATTIESNLQSSKANLAGGNTFTGTQWFNSSSLIAYNAPTTTPGAWNYSPSLISRTTSRAGVQIWAQEHPGVSGDASVGISYEWNGVSQTYWYFNQDGTINSGSKGNVAFTSQLPTAGTITGGYYKKIPISGGGFLLTQMFEVTVSDTGRVTFPFAYSSPPAPPQLSMAINHDVDLGSSSVDATGFTVMVVASGSFPISVYVEGVVQA